MDSMSIRRIAWGLDFVSCVAFHRENRIFGEVDVLLSPWGRPWGSRVQLKCDGTWRCMGGEVKGKLVIGMGSQYPSHYLRTW